MFSTDESFDFAGHLVQIRYHVQLDAKPGVFGLSTIEAAMH